MAIADVDAVMSIAAPRTDKVGSERDMILHFVLAHYVTDSSPDRFVVLNWRNSHQW